jgi:RimJ/RimL family protein N-acetyltransferase
MGAGGPGGGARVDPAQGGDAPWHGAATWRELVTARLRLRPYRADDFETVFRRLVLDPVVIRFWHAYADPGLSVAERRAMAERDLGTWIEEAMALGYPAWVIESREAVAVDRPAGGVGGAVEGGPMPGFVGVTGVFPPETDWGPEPEIGYLLASEHHGRGLATEAVRAVIADATDRLGIPVLTAIVDEPNVASIRVLEKTGFVLERTYLGDDGHPYRRYVRRVSGGGATAPP